MSNGTATKEGAKDITASIKKAGKQMGSKEKAVFGSTARKAELIIQIKNVTRDLQDTIDPASKIAVFKELKELMDEYEIYYDDERSG